MCLGVALMAASSATGGSIKRRAWSRFRIVAYSSEPGIGIGQHQPQFRPADEDAGAVPDIEIAGHLQEPQRFPHRRGSHGKPIRQFLDARQPVTRLKRIVLDQREHLLRKLPGQRSELRAIKVASESRFGQLSNSITDLLRDTHLQSQLPPDNAVRHNRLRTPAERRDPAGPGHPSQFSGRSHFRITSGDGELVRLRDRRPPYRVHVASRSSQVQLPAAE